MMPMVRLVFVVCLCVPVLVFADASTGLVAGLNAPASRAALDELARANTIESEAIGYAGKKSTVYAAYRRLVDAIGREDVLALLKHPSPVVRGYMADEVLEEYPSDVDRLETLLADAAHVGTQMGCVGGGDSVSGYVAQQICFSHNPSALEVLGRGARRSGSTSARHWAFFCLPKTRPADAIALARPLLGSKGNELGAALRALGEAGDAASVPVIVSHANDVDHDVRFGVAMALGALHLPAGLSSVRKLLDDPDQSVRAAAAWAYVRHAGFDRAVALRLATTSGFLVADRTKVGLAEAATPEALEILGSAHPSSGIMSRQIKDALLESSAGRAFILARPDLSDWQPAARVRGRPADAATLLTSPNLMVRSAAVTEVAQHPDASLVPVLEQLVDDKDGYVRQTATRILVALHSSKSLPVLEHRAASFPAEAAWLTPLITRLRRAK
jgi:HEAT repeat protein